MGKNYKYCKQCKCLDCTYVQKGDTCVKDFKKGCGAPKFKGDGFCDDNNNVGGCAWDGGDCCGAKANIKYCKGASVDFLNLRLGLPLGWSRKARFALLFISLVNAECECKDCTKK